MSKNDKIIFIYFVELSTDIIPNASNRSLSAMVVVYLLCHGVSKLSFFFFQFKSSSHHLCSIKECNMENQLKIFFTVQQNVFHYS